MTEKAVHRLDYGHSRDHIVYEWVSRSLNPVRTNMSSRTTATALHEQKSTRGRKTSAVREVLRSAPTLAPKEVVTILAGKGISVTTGYVATVRYHMKKKGENASVPDRSVTLQDLIKVKNVIQERGGIKKVSETVSSLHQMADSVGGIEKLRLGLDVLTKLAT